MFIFVRHNALTVVFLMHVLKSLGHKNLQLLLGLRSSNKH